LPVYGVAQSGNNPVSGLNLTCIFPGDSYTLFDGTETAKQGLASVAFARGYSAGVSDNGTTFYVTGMSPDETVDIQASNTDIDGDYYSVSGTLAPDTNGNAAYTDVGRPAFYRAILSTWVNGPMPVVKAQR
jgi:hypothetical protein